MGGHVLWRTCLTGQLLTGGPVLQKNLLMGGNVLLEACLKGEHVLEVDMSYRRMFFWRTYKYYREDMSYRRTYLTGEHVLLED